MSRYYLKQLQDRAQRLLQASSDEDEDVNAYTASQKDTKSAARIDLEELLDNNQSDSQLEESGFPKATDIQLLKKCIALTNENNNLKVFMEKQKVRIDHLEDLLSQQQAKEIKMEEEYEAKYQKEGKVEAVQITNKDLQDLKREITQLKNDKIQLKREYDVLQHQKEIFRRQKQQFEQYEKRQKQNFRQNTLELSRHHDFTIKTVKNQSPTHESINANEYLQRIKRAQNLLREQKIKVNKLCHFLNMEIPKLRDTIFELTTKLDCKVSKYLLRDIPF